MVALTESFVPATRHMTQALDCDSKWSATGVTTEDALTGLVWRQERAKPRGGRWLISVEPVDPTPVRHEPPKSRRTILAQRRVAARQDDHRKLPAK